MKQDSRVKKGKKLQRILRDKLLKAFPHLHPADIRVARSGENGEDLKLSRIARRLIPYQWDNKKPTAQMLGRWQPFHGGHYALFEEAIKNFKKVINLKPDFTTAYNNIFFTLLYMKKNDHDFFT